jgi:hypothetical protein
MDLDERADRLRFPIRDHKFTAGFDDVFTPTGVHSGVAPTWGDYTWSHRAHRDRVLTSSFAVSNHGG